MIKKSLLHKAILAALILNFVAFASNTFPPTEETAADIDKAIKTTLSSKLKYFRLPDDAIPEIQPLTSEILAKIIGQRLSFGRLQSHNAYKKLILKPSPNSVNQGSIETHLPNDNERSWLIKDLSLFFYNQSGEPTSLFNQYAYNQEKEVIVLLGYFKYELNSAYHYLYLNAALPSSEEIFGGLNSRNNGTLPEALPLARALYGIKTLEESRERFSQIYELSKLVYGNGEPIYAIPHISHRVWLTGADNPFEVPKDKLIAYFDSIKMLTSGSWLHYFWCMDPAKIPNTIRIIQESGLAIEIHSVSEIKPEMKAAQIFDEMIKGKAFAKASDILRLEIIYNLGGVYSDIGLIYNYDLTPLVDKYDNLLFDWDCHRADSVILAGKKHSPLLTRCLSLLENIKGVPSRLKLATPKIDSQRYLFDWICVTAAISSAAKNEKILFVKSGALISYNNLNSWRQGQLKFGSRYMPILDFYALPSYSKKTIEQQRKELLEAYPALDYSSYIASWKSQCPELDIDQAIKKILPSKLESFGAPSDFPFEIKPLTIEILSTIKSTPLVFGRMQWENAYGSLVLEETLEGNNFGTIGLNNHDNERSWFIDQNNLYVCNNLDEPTTIFNQYACFPNAKQPFKQHYLLLGYHKYDLMNAFHYLLCTTHNRG